MAPGALTPADADALLASILKRMNDSGGFPALDHSVARIVTALERSEDDITPLVDAVLADVSLTQKVLRLANSAMYAPIGRSVATVSHAMSVLGYEAVGHLALGVKLIGSLGQLQPASRSAERELARSLVAGSVAGSVVGKTKTAHGETGIVCSLLHRIGQLLTAFYLPEAWDRIRQALAEGADEDTAARATLGMTLGALGLRIAEQWRLPAKILRTMEADVPSQWAAAQAETEEAAWLLALTRFSVHSAGVVTEVDPAEAGAQLAELAVQFGPALNLPSDDLLQAVRAASDEATAKPFLADILLDKPKAAPAARSTTTPSAHPDVPSISAAGQDAPSRLQAGLAELRHAVEARLSGAALEERVLDVMIQALALSRAAILRLDAAGARFQVSTTRAARTPNRLAGATLDLGSGMDLARLALARKVDIYIDNPRDTKIATRLPDWIRGFSLHPFFLLPLTGTAGKPLGLIYGQQSNDAKLDKACLARLAEMRALLQGRMPR